MQATQLFLTANKIDKEDPEPLYLFYRTYRAANAPLPRDGVDALRYAAAILAPRRYLALAVRQLNLRQNNLKGARSARSRWRFFPHAGKRSRTSA